MSKALIIRGYCGTGKSSVAKYLAGKNNLAYLEYDNFLWSMNATTNPSKLEYEITFKNFLSVLSNYLKAPKDIIIEGPLVPRSLEDPFNIQKVIRIIKQANFNCLVVQLIAEDDVCVQRMKIRKHVVPKKERDMFKKKHDTSIQKDELIIDTSNLTIRQTINKIENLL